jgi:two-component system, sensor histidine kinase and response regulator
MQHCENDTSATVFDREGFLERIGGNELFVQKLVRSFIDSATEHLAVLGAAVEQVDAAAVRMQSHAIKGAAANIGAGHLKGLAEAMEAVAESCNPADMARRYASLEEAFALFKRVAVASLTDR